jgi:predicted dehydrogenase
MDMAVLAPHLFDQMRYLAGAPSWVCGYVTQNGRPIERADAVAGAEGVGLVGYYESYPGDRAGERWYGIEAHCTRGILSLRNLPRAEVYRYPFGLWMPPAEDGRWERILLPEWENAPTGTTRADADFTRASNRRHARSLIQALDQNAEPQGTTTAAEAVAVHEMLAGIYASHIVGARVALPLVDRSDPLAS